MSYGFEGKSETTEPALVWDKNILEQRSYYAENGPYNKPLVTKLPLFYRPGFHNLYDHSIHMETDENLVMFHLSSIDKDWCFRRMKYKFDLTSKMNPDEFGGGYADHWKRYHHDLSKGITCRFASACLVELEVNNGDDAKTKKSASASASSKKSTPGPFFGADELSKNVVVLAEQRKKEIVPFDNLGTIRMAKLDDLWRSVTI